MMVRSIKSATQPAAGFTLIELVIAMALFSSVLIIVVAGFINLIHLQSSTVATRDVQQNARYVMEDIIRTGRSNAAASQVTVGANLQKICFWSGDDGVQYFTDAAAKLWRQGVQDSAHNCASPSATIGARTALTSDDVKVVELTAAAQTSSVANNPAPPTDVELMLTVASTSGTLVSTGGQLQCDGNSNDRNYCAVTTLHDDVSLRGIQ